MGRCAEYEEQRAEDQDLRDRERKCIVIKKVQVNRLIKGHVLISHELR